jgi:hypothetical protein
MRARRCAIVSFRARAGRYIQSMDASERIRTAIFDDHADLARPSPDALRR